MPSFHNVDKNMLRRGILDAGCIALLNVAPSAFRPEMRTRQTGSAIVQVAEVKLPGEIISPVQLKCRR